MSEVRARDLTIDSTVQHGEVQSFQLGPREGLRRIGFVSNSGFSLYRFRLGVLNYLAALEFEVVCVAPLDRFAEQLVHQGFEYARIKVSSHGTSPLIELRDFKLLKKRYAALKLDLVFHYTIKPNIYGSLAAKQLGIPSVAVVTGLGAFANGRMNFMSRAVRGSYGFAVQRAAEVWFLNDYDRGYFEAKDWSNRSSSKLLPSEGIDGEEFPFLKVAHRKKTFEVLFVGRLLYSKGLADLVEAIKLIRSQGLAVRCHVVGFANDENPDSIPVEVISAWHREKAIVYHGGADDIQKFLKLSHAVVLPSYYNEGMSRILLEALASGRPIITTKTQGCGELVRHGINGLAVPERNPAALAEAITQLAGLTRRELEAYGQAGREQVLEEYSVQRVIEIYSAFLYGRLKTLAAEQL